MKTFTIENETHNITVHASAKEAEAVLDSERLSNEAALAKLAEIWPMARLVEIWNSLPGATPAKKFKDRATAVSRIWKALQSLGETVTAEATEQPNVNPVIATPQEAETVPPEPEATPLADEPVIPATTEPAPARSACREFRTT